MPAHSLAGRTRFDDAPFCVRHACQATPELCDTSICRAEEREPGEMPAPSERILDGKMWKKAVGSQGIKWQVSAVNQSLPASWAILYD